MFEPLATETLQQHYQCASEILQPYTCRKCCFRTQFKVYYHNHDHKIQAISPIPTEHLCRKCKFRSHSIVVFTNHAYKKCTKDYSPEDSEAKVNKVQDKKVEPSKRFACKQCPFLANRPNGLAIHVKHKHLDVIQCDKCDFTTTQKTVLNKHMKVMHKDMGFIRWLDCNMCDFKTKLSQEFQDHVKNGHPTNALSRRCHLCGCQTRTNENYTYHRLSHQV